MGGVPPIRQIIESGAECLLSLSKDRDGCGAWPRLLLGVAFALLLVSCDNGFSPLSTPASSTPAASGAAPTCGPAASRIASIARSGQRAFSAAPERVIDPSKSYEALIKTDKGDIKIELAARDAPNTVNNFVFLSCTGFYDGLTFHRVVSNPPVIQGGDPRGDGTGGPGYRFANEISPNLRHDAAGVVAMANAGPNTNGSQFYITLNPIPPLDGGYNVFGRVTAGMDAVNAIRVGDKILSVSIQER